MAEKIVMLALSPTMETGTISKWTKQEGDRIESGDVLCEVETDKATMDYESSNEGHLLKILVPQGGRAKVGDPIAIVGEKGEDFSSLLQQQPTPSTEHVAEGQPVSAPPGPERKEAAQPVEGNLPQGVRASPLARRLAQEKGIDLKSVRGSGPQGRIVTEDLEKAKEVPSPAPSPPPPTEWEGEQVVRISEKRRIIAQRMTESMRSAPHYYLTVVVNVDPMLDLRKRRNAGQTDKVSLNAFLVKFVAEALKRHPTVNSSWAEESIVRHARIDVGLAVAQSDGLIAPVVRDCGSKGISAIHRDLKDLIERALKGQLAPEEYKNPTFTISNLGSYGISEFTAIINPPAAAILAVGEIRREPVVGPEDEVVIGSRMTLTLSCDHRVLDGAVAAAFLKELKDMIEDPLRVLF